MSGFTGTGRLVRLAVRRDRVKLLVWIAGVPAVTAATVASVTSLYGTEEARFSYALTSAGNVVARAFNGPSLGNSLGAVAYAESYFLLVLLTALLSTFTVVRHTRQNEDTGRAELLGSAVVGRYAQLAAALITTAAANLLTGVLLVGVFVGYGLPVAGSLAAGLSTAAVGVSFAAVAAVTAQVASSARGANGLASAAVGLAFLLRAIGDALGRITDDGLRVVSAWPTWLSPLGWASQVRPFDVDRWWVFLLPGAFVLAATAAAGFLAAHRDFGAGLVQVRRGPTAASRWLLSPLGLAWRLQRPVLIGWAAGVVVMSLPMGVVGDQVDDMLRENPAAAEVIAQLGGGAGLVDAYLSAMLLIFAWVVAGYAVQSVLRARSEEATGTLEGVLAGSVSRTRWLVSHLLCAWFGTVLLFLLAGSGVGLGYGLAVGDVARELPRMAGAALVHVPAAAVLAGVVVVFFGLLPQWSVALSWTALAACVLLGQLGELLELPQIVLDLSPFTHVPSAPAVDPAAQPLVVLGVVALALTAAGIAFFRRRDVAL
ncbi:MAG TPA: anibiotic ABC transporter [Micromonosporaceae bacterium]|nr:anibiotic ABC transporter [Micromonosporaceae bacterium]